MKDSKHNEEVTLRALRAVTLLIQQFVVAAVRTRVFAPNRKREFIAGLGKFEVAVLAAREAFDAEGGVFDESVYDEAYIRYNLLDTGAPASVREWVTPLLFTGENFFDALPTDGYEGHIEHARVVAEGDVDEWWDAPVPTDDALRWVKKMRLEVALFDR